MSVPAYLMEDADCGCENTTPDTPLAQAESAEPFWVANTLFFPMLDLHDFEKTHQVDASFNEYRRLQKLKQAIRETNGELEEQVCSWVRAGYHTLSEVPYDQHERVTGTDDNGVDSVDVESVLVETYKTAVYAKAMQLINNRYRGTDTKEYAQPRATVMESVALDYEQVYRESIYTLTGHRGQSIFVALI